MNVENNKHSANRQRFIDICNGTTDSPVFTVMKDKSLLQKNRKGEFLINKVGRFKLHIL